MSGLIWVIDGASETLKGVNGLGGIMRTLKFAILALAVLVPAACGKPADQEIGAVERTGSAETGRALFVQKGCVLCHAVNGVGGKAAPPLDAADPYVRPDPLEFAAKMWRGAPAMVEFQSVELGYVIDLSADDIAHLAAFAASREQQELLTDAAIPEPMRDSLLDERYWEMEDWSDFMANGQEGFIEPAPPIEAPADGTDAKGAEDPQ